MIKQLRFDGYKLLHSKTMLGVLIVTMILALVNPLISAITSNDSAFLSLRAMTSSMFANVSAVLFVAFFVGADYRSGYVKTIVTRINWACYILSKVIYTFAFCILFAFAYQLFFILFTLIGGGKIYTPDTIEARQGGLVYYKLLCETVVAFTYGMLVMFVLMTSKSTIAALVVGIVYTFLSAYFYDLADIILVKVFGAKQQEYSIFAKYTVLGTEQWFFDMFYGGEFPKHADIVRFSLVTLLYSLAAVGFSILICYLRKRKN